MQELNNVVERLNFIEQPLINDFFILSKEEITSYATDQAELVSGGALNSLQSLIRVKKIEHFLKIYESIVRPIAEDQHHFDGKNKYREFYTEITSKEIGSKYDYSECNDQVLNKLLEKQTELNEEIKKRQEFLKKLPNNFTLVDEETGEVSVIKPPVKSGRIGLNIQLI